MDVVLVRLSSPSWKSFGTFSTHHLVLTHGISENHQKTPNRSPLPNQFQQGHQNCSIVPIQVVIFQQEKLGCPRVRRHCLPCASSVLRATLQGHSIEPVRSTFAWVSFSLSSFPNTSFSSMIPGSSLGFPNCTATFPMAVVEPLTIEEGSLTFWSFSSSCVAPRSSAPSTLSLFGPE